MKLNQDSRVQVNSQVQPSPVKPNGIQPNPTAPANLLKTQVKYNMSKKQMLDAINHENLGAVC